MKFSMTGQDKGVLRSYSFQVNKYINDLTALIEVSTSIFWNSPPQSPLYGIWLPVFRTFGMYFLIVYDVWISRNDLANRDYIKMENCSMNN